MPRCGSPRYPRSRPAAALAGGALLALVAGPATGIPPDPEVIAGPGFRVAFHSRLDEHESYSDVWGYTTPEGREYALLGCFEGIAIVDLDRSIRGEEVAFLPRADSRWRDVKTYDRYSYDVSEGGTGIRVVDLADPANPSGVGTFGGFVTAHNLYIDEAAARAYVAGADGTGGVRIYDLSDPRSPSQLGSWDRAYAHDVYARGDRMVASGIQNQPVPALYVVDVSNPGQPLTLGQISGYPHAATHNAWLTDDGNHVLVTDEADGGALRIWDITDPTSPIQRDAFFPPGAPRAIPHNVHVDGDLAFVSYYTAGVRVVDLSDPTDLREVAWYDTHPPSNAPYFQGVWGVYPHFPLSPNRFLASDIDRGLYVLEIHPGVRPGAFVPTGFAPIGDAGSPHDARTEPVAPASLAPAGLLLQAPAPNPLRAGRRTALELRTPAAGPARIRVHDSRGRVVRTLLDASVAPGARLVDWDGRDSTGRPVASGTYWIRALGPGGTAVRPVTVLR